MALSEQLEALEQRLNHLLSILDSLAAENQELKTHEQSLQAQCIALHKKNEAASRRIETILQQLKQQTTQDKEE
ncbi:MAG: hypothetical protein R3E95_13360 [Thiolinea sp.]